VDKSGENRSGDNLIFLLKGFVFPFWSVKFYREATQKRLAIPIAFLFLFSLIPMVISTIQVWMGMTQAREEVTSFYQGQGFPSITIENGIATADPRTPFIFSDGEILFAIDTTGSIQEIDTAQYAQGVLLTRTEFHVLQTGRGYRRLPLVGLNDAFGDPIQLDEQHVLGYWDTLTLIVVIAAMVGVYLWHAVGRLVELLLLGLVVWGIASLIRKGIGFSPILSTGIFASVPAFYLNFLFEKLKIQFFGMFTLLLLVFWIGFLVLALREEKPKPDISLPIPPTA
jgi:hypothetical protein